MTDADGWDSIAATCEEALRRTLDRYRLRRVRPGLTGEYDVAWANDVAFLSVVLEPRAPFGVMVGRLVDGALPDFLSPGWDFLDADFFVEDAGLTAPDRPPMAPRVEDLREALVRYDALLPAVVGSVLRGDMAELDRMVEVAKARADEDDD